MIKHGPGASPSAQGDQFRQLIASGDEYANKFCFAEAEGFYKQALDQVSQLEEMSAVSVVKIRLACLYELWGNIKESTRYVLEAMELLGYAGEESTLSGGLR